MEISTNEVSCCGEPKTMMWCLLQTGCGNKARVSQEMKRWKVGIVTLFQVFQDRFFGLHFILSISASNASMSVRWICKKQKFVVRYPITEKNRSIHKLYIYSYFPTAVGSNFNNSTQHISYEQQFYRIFFPILQNNWFKTPPVMKVQWISVKLTAAISNDCDLLISLFILYLASSLIGLAAVKLM